MEEQSPPQANKYKKQTRIGGQAKIGRSANYVTTVGLGNLEVTTAHGNNNV